MDMINKSGLAIATAILLGTGSVALAAAKHPAHYHHLTAQSRPAGASAYGSAVAPGGYDRRQLSTNTSANAFGQEPDYMLIQDRDMRRSD
jgi:hypothetical protein